MKLSLGLTPRDYSVSGGAVAYDTDAQAYFTANTAITSAADKNAINTFYLDLKSDGIYTKIKAMYLPIWGSAASCKWNLVNPLDTDAAFRLNFSIGWSYSSSGITPTNAYVNTFFNPSVQLNQDSASYGIYGQTEVGVVGSTGDGFQHGVVHTGVGLTLMIIKNTAGNTQNFINSTTATGISGAVTKAFNQMSRTSSTNTYHSKNSTVTTVSLTRTGNPNYNFYWGARNDNGGVATYSPLKFSFMYMGTGLTNTEMQNFYTRVNTLMAYFGINTYPVVSDADAQAYINANDSITSQSDANAINTFFTGLKADGIYTKIKAMYLPIWGSAASCKWNLVNPLDTPDAFRLNFTVGWTYSSNGITGNGSSTYANTFLTPKTTLTVNNTHLSIYMGNNTAAGNKIEMGVGEGASLVPIMMLMSRYTGDKAYSNAYNLTTNQLTPTNTDRKGFYCGSRTSSTSHKLYKNNTILATDTNTNSNILPNLIMLIGTLNSNNAYPVQSTDGQFRFITIGDGLNDTENNNLYSRINTLMTYFGINV